MATSSRAQQDIDAQIVHLERELLELKRQRNKLSPISTVPPEILCRILLLATSYAEGVREFSDLPKRFRVDGYIGTLCHVSHSWRVTALDCPQLWAEIDVRNGTDGRRVDFVVDHARPLPITLHFAAEEPRFWSRQYCQVNAMESIQKALSEGVCFNKLVLSGRSAYPTHLLKYVLPTELQTLQINITSDNVNPAFAQHPIFANGVPGLRTFTIEGYTIPLTSPILHCSPHITTLSMPVPRASHATHVLEMLKAVRQVQQLDLYFHGPFPSSPASLHPVHLPHLSKVNLRGYLDSILTTLSQFRLSATSVFLSFGCVHHQSQHDIPTSGALLFRAIGQARCLPDSTSHTIPSDGICTPRELEFGNPNYSKESHVCYIKMDHGTTHGRATLEEDARDVTTIVAIKLETLQGWFHLSPIHWAEWHPLVLAKHPKDLQLMIGWSMDALHMVSFSDGTESYPDLYWELLSRCPWICRLVICPIHVPKLLPHLSADNGSLPFPSLDTLGVQPVDLEVPNIPSTGSGAKPNYSLERLVESLRIRRSLCEKYGVSKEWVLRDMCLEGCISGPETLLLRTARDEKLIGKWHPL